MKPTGRIELAFETGLIFCFGYGIEDGELQDSFRESLTLRLVVEVHSLLFLASQIQKEHSMDDLLKFFMLLLIRVLLKPSFFMRQHKIDLEQYPLALPLYPCSNSAETILCCILPCILQSLVLM